MAETLEITVEEVVAAGRVLFGPAFVVDGAGWREALRSTYRRRALETHPDRARALGRSEGELAREFQRVADAHRVLSALCSGPAPRFRRRTAAPPPRPRPAARTAPPRPARADAARPTPPPRRPEAGPGAPRGAARHAPTPDRPEALPRRHLRFAEFLYYSGKVPFTALVDAIAWQRRQRPAIGRIAVEWGFLTADDVRVILERRRIASAHAVPFGEFAVRLGYLSSFQLLALLGRQLRLQRRIGEFFVERGYLRAEDVDPLRSRIARHNLRWAR